jgi:hypothetical protein
MDFNLPSKEIFLYLTEIRVIFAYNVQYTIS